MTISDPWTPIKSVGLCLLAFALTGAFVISTIVSDHRAVKSGIALPRGAINIVIVGEGWFEFDYKGQHFLYHRYKLVNDMSECLAVINASEGEK